MNQSSFCADQSKYEQHLSHNMLSNNSYIHKNGIENYLGADYDNGDWSEDYSERLCEILNESGADVFNDGKAKLGITIAKMAKHPKGCHTLRKILLLNNNFHTQRVLFGTLHSIFEVMISEIGHRFFIKLIESITSSQVELILAKFYSNLDLFVQTAFTRHGSISIQMLIKSLKKKPLAYFFSHIVSLRFYQLMTHRSGRYVVEQCFHVFDEKQNEVLYRGIIRCFKELATTESGCASLNVCISCITNPLKRELLDKIAQQSAYLANDPWGNFVVQHVISLKDEETLCKIFRQLENQYASLALTKGGSHVVEKCIASSKSGTISVVDKLLADEKSLFLLVKDSFGNYVVQSALKSTKEHGEEKRHQSLVKVLTRRQAALAHNTHGKHVITTINSLNPRFTKKTFYT